MDRGKYFLKTPQSIDKVQEDAGCPEGFHISKLSHDRNGNRLGNSLKVATKHSTCQDCFGILEV